MSRPENDIKFRPAQAEDVKFIMSTWKQSWRVCPWAGTVRNDEFFKVIRNTIEGLVLRGAEFKIAYLEKYPTRILGWVCYEVLTQGECCIHYLYVKDPYIPLNIGVELINECPGTKPGFYTHRYRQVTDAIGEGGWRHAPEIARRK